MTTTFTINGRDIHTDQGDANTFKGFGYLNCNNSSRLLLDYKWQQPEAYQAVLHTLFGGPHPLMRMLKVKLGADANTSSGTEPSPKRSAAGGGPAVGYHYRTSDGDNRPFTQLADTYHHEVWYSEGVGPILATPLPTAALQMSRGWQRPFPIVCFIRPGSASSASSPPPRI